MSSPSLIYSFFKDSALQLKQSNLVQYVSMPVNFQITFDINPKSIVYGYDDWQNIFHISSNNTNFTFGGGVNPRTPGLWFQPGTFLFHLGFGVVDKSTQDVINFSTGQEMPTNSWSSITIDVYNGKMTLTALKADGKMFSQSITLQNNSVRKELQNCYFYAADPWYVASDSQIRNFNIYSYDSTSPNSIPSGLNFEAFTGNKSDKAGYIYGSAPQHENALSIFSGKYPVKVGTTTSINCKETGYSKYGLTDKNPTSVMISFFGYFKPNKSGIWKFYFGTGGLSNDDLSTFWFGDNALNPSTNNFSYKADFTFTLNKADQNLYSWTTPELTKDTYYPVLLNWGQYVGGAIMGFGFQEPGSTTVNYDMTNLFYSYKPANLSTPSLIFDACKNTDTTLVQGKSYGTINMPMNYRIEIKINPTGTVGEWSNIFTIVNNNNNYNFADKDIVSRNPGLWFHGNTTQLHCAVGVPRFTQYYYEWFPSEGLTKNSWNTVTIDVVDGQMKTEDLLGNGKKYNNQILIQNYGFRKEMKNSVVYLSDPWHKPGKAYVKDFKIYSYDSGITDNTSCYYQLSDLEAQCYLDRYADLKNAYGSDLNAAKNHWTQYGCKDSEKRRNECPAPQKSAGRYSYIGCYGDNGDRAIPTYNGNVSNVDDCASIAEKVKANVFGIQYGGECWTGTDVNAAKKYFEKANRDTCKNMGGGWGNNVYVRDEAFPPPAPSEINLSSPDFSVKPNEGFLNRELITNCKRLPNLNYGDYTVNYDLNHKGVQTNKVVQSNKVETFTDNAYEQLSVGDKQLYNQVFCDLYPTNNGFNSCTNCTFKGSMKELEKKNFSSETDCLNDCKSKKNCSGYTYDTLATTDNCTQYYTFPQDIDYENSPNKNSGYSLLFPYDYQKLDDQQKKNVQTKCMNQYLNNTYSIGSNMNDCIKIDKSNSSVSKIDIDAQCAWNKMAVNGKPSVRDNNVYLDNMGFTPAMKDKELDNYKKVFDEVVKANDENKSGNQILMQYNQKFKEYNSKLEKEDEQYKSDYESILKGKIDKINGDLEGNTKKINPEISVEKFMDQSYYIDQTESYLKFVTLMIIVLLFFIIMYYAKSSMMK